jgi:tetratricopeptide (TPR) repeat protein
VLFPLFLFVVSCAVLWSASASAQERPPWWDGRWRYRELVSINPNQEFADSPFVQVRVHIRADADHAGTDIRVVAPDGRPVSLAIAHASPDGQYLIAFQAPQKQGLYGVYYDNPHADAVRQTPPPRGLLYETRPIPEKTVVNSWADAQAALARAVTTYGAAYWNRVFDAYNPFGPQSDYIAVYRGYVRCPQAGQYKFATVSDQASFLLVDDQLVAEWPGAHIIRQGQRGEHSGAIELTQGMHRFLYVSFSFGAAARAEAAWMPPGSDRFEVMPHSAFPGLPEAEVFEGEWYNQPLCADFTSRPESYCEAPAATGGADTQMTAVKFASKSTTSGNALIDSYLWDFGDGQTAADPQPRHVFLAPGTYAVTLNIASTAGDRTSCTKKVKVGPIYEDLDFPRKKLETFWGYVKGYHPDKLPTPLLLAEWQFAKEMEKTPEAFEIAKSLDGRRDQLEPARVYDVAMDLGRYYEDVERRPDKAEEYFNVALQSAPQSDQQRRFNALFALCDHHFYYLGQAERAREEYRKLRSDFPQTDPARRRVALIRIGDTFACDGKAQEALGTYREAEGDPAYVPSQPRAVMRGSMIQEVESALRSGDGDAALSRLEELLWYYPTMRIEGQPALLRVKANLLKGKFDEARKQADIFIRISRDPNWLPAVHVGAAEACFELGLTQDAAQHYKAVLKDFPESPEVKDAEEGLRHLGE